MLDLNNFFEGMSKPLLRNAHAKAYGKKGLLNNNLILTETLSYFCDKDRVAAIASKMESWQRRTLCLIYHSGSRGLSFNELRLTIPVAKVRDLENFLLEMCRDYVIWRSSASTSTYQGFHNFVGIFEMVPEEPVDLSLPKVSYQNLADWHLCMVLALAMKKELRVNANGTLHRRGRQLCSDSFTAARQLSENAAENELVLIFSFLVKNGWLDHVDPYLLPSEKAFDFLKRNGFRLHQDLISWWLESRFHGDREHCIQLLKTLQKGCGVTEASFLFWILDPSYRIVDRNKSYAWENLPRILREMWLLGLVDFQLDHGKISAVVLSESGAAWISTSIASIPEASLSALPNFDLVASTGTSPRVLFVLASLAKVKNDEAYLCFTLEKESYLAGLRCGLPETEIEAFRTWIKPPENVASTLMEWNASFYGARVRTVRLLKIDDLKILAELSRFPHFVECTDEYIPGYGFVLKPEGEARAYEILESFGYCPFMDHSTENRQPAPTDEWKKEFVIPWPTSGNPDYELKDAVDETAMRSSMDSTKYGSVYQKLNTGDLVKVLRYAKMAGTLLAAKVKDPNKRTAKQEEKFFFVHALHLAKSPFTVDVQEYESETKYPLDLSFVQEVKTLNSKTL